MVTVLNDEARGGSYNIWLDNQLKMQPTNYAADGSNPFSGVCYPQSFDMGTLDPSVTHNVTVENAAGGQQELMVQNITYAPGSHRANKVTY